MVENEDPPNAERAARPFWQWILLAVAPGLVADLAATLMALTADQRSLDELQGGLMGFLILVPLAFIPYLIVVSKPYTAAHGKFDAGSRAWFVIGFLVVNLFLWGGSCAIALSYAHLNFH
jgi:hypothetical protein